MIPKIPYHLIIFIGLILMGCMDVVEKDISQEQVKINLPREQAEINSETVNFWWNPIEGATAYRLTFVEGSFESPMEKIAEINLGSNLDFYDTTFAIGSYEWMIVAENFGYTSIPAFSTFTVLDNGSEDLNTSTVELIFPEQNTIFNTPELSFTWATISTAEFYNFQLARPDFSDSNNIISSELLTTTSFSIMNLIESDYEWRVRAENNSGTSPFTTRNFTLDLTAPEIPLLESPLNNAVVSDTVDLSWMQNNDVAKYKLEISLDSTFQNPVSSLDLMINNYSFTTGLIGEQYFWRTQSVDLAGNQSGFSNFWSFSIQ